MQPYTTIWMWIGFIVFVIFVLWIDINVLGRKKSHRVSTKDALIWVLTWMALALIFNAGLWTYLDQTQNNLIATRKALEFFTGYLLEFSLSIDNMFAFILIFNYFIVPPQYQRRVLLYGVIGAIVMRFLMITGGLWLVHQLHWILYLFGAFLIITGIKMIFPAKEQEFANHFILRNLKKIIRIDTQYHQEHFFIKKNKLLYATPLLVVLIFIELTDVLFALDSIPAIFAITQDAFIIFTSNIFAILGLRALYFLLVNSAERFHFLKYGIAVMLTFIGVKMLIEPWMPVPVLFALSFMLGVLSLTIVLSLLVPKGKK